MENIGEDNLIISLIGALIGLSRSTDGNKNRPTMATHESLLTGMYMALPSTIISKSQIAEQIVAIHREKEKLVPRCTDCKKQCGRNDDFSIADLKKMEPNLSAIKEALLFGLLSLEPLLRDCKSQDLMEKAMDFLYRGLFYVGNNCKLEDIIPLLSELAEIFQNLSCFLQHNSKSGGSE